MADLLPQEIEVHYVIPALRREIALRLKERGMKQKDIATMLGIRPSAVSNYLHNHRGVLKLNSMLHEQIDEKTSQISSHVDYVHVIQQLLVEARTQGAICTLHKKMCPAFKSCSLHMNEVGICQPM